ncbi:UNVERIFIED_CONTAM: hypothetical protein Slati_4541700 [Sesamum latifolium]|uniref:Integrase catalytic domain-containing protein n=1 Tax=Sesamum latifolium TaxID=2727402 RepID=A0AAW2SFN5_9LAMI
MTKKPFIGQNAIANSLLDLVHTDVCEPLNTPARGGYSYFITFTDDHSWYGYVYLIGYKSEAFGRFKEYRLKVENQTSHKIKALRSDRGGEYLSGEFIDYLKENEILSQWTPPGTPQLKGVAERRNRTLLDMVRSMMSFTELPPSFWGYTLERAAKLLNIASSKTVPQTPYEIWTWSIQTYKSEAFGRFKEYRLEVENQTSHKIKALRSDRGGEYLSGEFIDYLKENEIVSQWTPPGTPQLKGVAERRNRTLLEMVRSMMSFTELPPSFWGYTLERAAKLLNIAPSKTNAVFLEKDFPADSRRDEVLLKESSEEPRHDSTISFEPPVVTDSVPVLRRSTRESRAPERYGFMGLTSQLDNDPKIYGEAMSGIDSEK